MQHFKINDPDDITPEPQTKYFYPVGSLVVFVKDLSESVNLTIHFNASVH